MQSNLALNDFSAETLYSVCLAASANKNWKELLDDVLTLSRKYFIVDNLAIFLTEPESHRIDVIYAKSFGRGKSAEADVSWGETVANQVVLNQEIHLERPASSNNPDRFAQPYILATPLRPTEQTPGAVAFIRFGGPDYTPESIQYATYLSYHVSAILQKKMLQETTKKLADKSSEKQLQESFINTISHELRNPLGFIKGYTTTLLREDTRWDTTTQTDFLKIIDRETNNLQELIDNLLDSSRLQSGQMKFDSQIVRVDALIRDELSRAQVNHPGLQIHLDFEEPVHTIEGDPRRLAQVLDNLISNSIKYAPEKDIFITTRNTKNFLVIDYRDAGLGVSEKFLPDLFTRFFRDPEQSIKVHGSGLGLSICKEIIEHHNGEINASCPPGWGLVFSIRLPYTQFAAQADVGVK